MKSSVAGSMNIEQEIKVLLSKEQYELLETKFTWEKTLFQKNTYYTAMDKQEEKAYNTIRIRELDGMYYLQVKMPVSESGSLHVKKEYEKKVDGITETISHEQLEEMTGLDLPTAKKVGTLATERKLCYREEMHAEICLDKSDYLGVTDYELEVEYTDEYPGELVKQIEDYGIDVNRHGKGKCGRFFAKAEEQGY